MVLTSAAPGGAAFFSLKHVDPVTCIASSESAVLSHAWLLSNPPLASHSNRKAGLVNYTALSYICPSLGLLWPLDSECFNPLSLVDLTSAKMRCISITNG